MTTGHNIVTGAVFDIHWVDSGVKKVTYGCTAGTVSAAPSDTSIPFTGGTGDVLPAASSTITFCKVTSVVAPIDGDNVKILGIEVTTTTAATQVGAHIKFEDSGDAEIAEVDLVTNTPKIWYIENGDTNPFTGNLITEILVSHANESTTDVNKVKIVGTTDATP